MKSTTTAPRFAMTPKLHSRMVDLLESGFSFHAIGRETGIAVKGVERWLRPVVAILSMHGIVYPEAVLRRRSLVRSRITSEQIAEIGERLKSAASLREIARDMNLGSATVRVYARPHIAVMRESGALGTCACGREPFHIGCCKATSRATPERLAKRAEILAAIMAGETYKSIGVRWGMTKESAESYSRHLSPEQLATRAAIRQKYRQRSEGEALVRSAGIVACLINGETYSSIAQRWGVSPTWVQLHLCKLTPEQRTSRAGVKRARGCGPRGHARHQTSEHLAKRANIIASIIGGEAYAKIGERWGISENSARKYLRYLTPEQQAKRDVGQKAQRSPRLSKGPRNRRPERGLRAKKHEGVATRPFRDPVYSRIAAAVPRWLSDATRDDAISELYVAVLEGRISDEELTNKARLYASDARNKWESRYGPRSLDECAFEGSKESLVDRIADPESLIPLEYRLDEKG